MRFTFFRHLRGSELQASLSRMEREGQPVVRELYLIDEKNYVLAIDDRFLSEASKQGLHLRFSKLKGADLVFACAATLEKVTLVTTDKDFLGIDGLLVVVPS